MTMKKLIAGGLAMIGILIAPVSFSSEEHGAGDKHETGNADEHEHEESPSGASFKPDRGVILTEETKKILGVETAAVAKEKLPNTIHFNVQLYGDVHRFSESEIDHFGCDSHGAGFVPSEKAALIQPKAPVSIVTAKNKLEGFVVSVQGSPALGESEVVIGMVKGDADIKDGEFATATLMEPRNEEVNVIPRSALLTTVEGKFVYRVHDGGYLRVPVKQGSQTDDKIEIVEGLNPDDEVVTSAVETVRLIELRATKGGGHSH